MMRLQLSNPIRIHTGPKGTTRIDANPHGFNVTLTSPDGNSVTARMTISHRRAMEIFNDLSGHHEDTSQ